MLLSSCSPPLPAGCGPSTIFFAPSPACPDALARHVLPGLTLARKLVEASDLDLLELPGEAFCSVGRGRRPGAARAPAAPSHGGTGAARPT
jgi:hypothetical protein